MGGSMNIQINGGNKGVSITENDRLYDVELPKTPNEKKTTNNLFNGAWINDPSKELYFWFGIPSVYI